MQYKIPQNVRVEDKIVGPLTLKQLVYLGVGGGLAYASYTILASKYFIEIWLPPTLFITIVTLAVTFLKINGIPFTRWIFLVVEYMINPRKRSFSLGSGDHYQASIFAKEAEKSKTEVATNTDRLEKAERIKKLGEITKLVDDYQIKEKNV
ncbi:PrgI family protein [Candidatus Peregrinibacteria bacterium]|jgi:hypothetical protein|nr:PrgI family protein [Candidatus Peregrinibacteria bacterium]MBT4631592.1 PrgI family protein [Candidatus Peregrinibacteria bacterium]MBT5516807.1 PrgI family protein [Candidatus Peregrinibacteria bacterium]MBT5824111.1 PrgI family protein [Candidatus Peregrinibacteria bacterium]